MYAGLCLGRVKRKNPNHMLMGLHPRCRIALTKVPFWSVKHVSFLHTRAALQRPSPSAGSMEVCGGPTLIFPHPRVRLHRTMTPKPSEVTLPTELRPPPTQQRNSTPPLWLSGLRALGSSGQLVQVPADRGLALHVRVWTTSPGLRISHTQRGGNDMCVRRVFNAADLTSCWDRVAFSS